MFSVFKKLATKTDGPLAAVGGTGALPESVGQQMSDSLRKKFSRGVQYNMKVIVKGDRNVGKSCLLARLQGKAFLEQYNPTEQIQVASIQWSFKATDDIVKVEVWDVVDRGKAKQKSGALKLNTDVQADDIPVLDAEFLDVYKGTHCVVMMMDITKAWTFEYVCRELPKVPGDIPVLLLGNHCDMGHHRVISKDQIQGFIEETSQTRTAEIVYGDSSMRNGFGLRLLHKFFGIPFLYLQRSALEASIKKNEQDADICRLEINEFLKSNDAEYSTFLENLTNRKKANEPSAYSHSSSLPSTPLEALPRPTKSIILGGGHPIIVPDKNSHLAVASTSTVNTAKLASPAAKLAPLNASQGVDALRIPKSATMGSISTESDSGSGFVAPGGIVAVSGSPGGKISNVDEFCPDGGVLDKSFLEDAVDAIAGATEGALNVESESDDESRHNPLVSRFDDEFTGAVGADLTEYDQLHKCVSGSSELKGARKSNPLLRHNLTPSPNNVALVDRAYSLSSIELEIGRVTVEEELGKQADVDTGILPDNESWSLDTKERRSPEGGEDIDSNVSVTCPKSGASSKKSKDKEKDRSSKHKKSKKSSREKDESREERRRSKRRSHVDDFVQEMKSSAEYCEEAYEAI
ncbi:rab-like protein 6 [Topomyia yanbarensis]|uniref:rab-like protein 6 n=1 Tax=Topomyia yanbarensis TaxID=2498891 RepID=UPI00273B36AF|nr:rab-like protein 6 [Topomyia yanbarensis]XP_058832380.1 rab-like protein 6 [Topomyia yanbarensis]